MTTRAKCQSCRAVSYNPVQNLLRLITKKTTFCTRPDKNAYRSQLNGRLPLPSPPNLFCLEEKGV